ncbi:toll/interleukin-1 receptor domain-containing protein [Halomonas titanicae]|uniref:toll/interleukin-1 receptor domain-containing protein n=1 Tax=Vreelandella titanicae TaxID=664683 RepID=UPI001F42537D|nr:toll/interleukin-1 receptor domain-containing protein [Halomonas titanicae]MCE7518229.1 toll/interleukin-1 receptor domain-containing protein [Halomonas titanicae]
MNKDIFICHASEDKASVARPLAACLSERGLSYWIDEAEISAGESITQKVNEGLKVSKFVVVIFSRAFMSKHWAKRELWSVLNQEAKSGKIIIIPLLVGSQTEVAGIIDEFPLLNDKSFLLWDGDANSVSNAIQNAVLKVQGASPTCVTEMHSCGHCATPFMHGVHVCLGCQGSIKYGLTQRERMNIRKISAAIIGMLSFITMVHFPSYSESWLGLEVPMMWGMGFWSIPLAAILALGAGLYFEARAVARKALLVRTFR